MKIILMLMFSVLGTNTINGFVRVRETCHEQVKTVEQRRAEEFWEKAVQAKGGRERLYSVKNIVEFSGQTKDKKPRYVTLAILPDKMWEWMDDRDTPIGLAVDWWDVSRNIWFRVVEGHLPEKYIEAGPATVSLQDMQIRYLLETNWMKPVIISGREGKFENKKVFIVETLVKGNKERRVDFYFDLKTHLPINIAYISAINKQVYEEIALDNYTEVDSISMPTSIRFSDTSKIPVKVELDVDYDETIFENPPSIEAGPNAWRKKLGRTP